MQNWESTVRWVWQYFPATRLIGSLGHIGDMRAGVVVQQKNSMLPIGSFLLNSCLEWFHLLNIEFRVDRLLSFKQVVMDNPFPVQPYAQRGFTICVCVCVCVCRLFTGAKPFLALLHVNVKAPFFIASDDSVRKSLLVFIS